MDTTPTTGAASAPAEDQRALWQGRAAHGWLAAQDLVERMLAPLDDVLVDAVCATPARHVLDVGCGAGGTTLAVARRIASDGGRCVGVDVSESMIEAARRRADGAVDARVSFVLADAQRHAFEPGAFDVVMSRFGVMFFDDPVAAFTNLRRAAADGARLRLLVWRGPEDNPFMTTAERTAAPLVPGITVRRTGDPGPFALADPEHVTSVVRAAGWRDVRVTPVDAACSLPASELRRYFESIGPVARVLPDLDDATRASVLDTVLDAHAPFVDGEKVRYVAACHLVSASAG